MSLKTWLRGGFAALVAAFAVNGAAQQMVYGTPVPVESARKAAAAAVAEARKNNWIMAVAIVDTAGELVYFERMDGVAYGSIPIAQDKAHAAAIFKRPTKAAYDEMEKGGAGLRYLNLRGFVTSEGGELIVQDGKIVGAIGCSGGSGAQDGQCARAGLAALK